jgi:SAM-dependent methyltransferase
MPKPHTVSDPQYLSRQYKDASNLNARIRLHEQFSTNKYGWQRWLFDQFDIPPQARILELGCGPGNLWSENIDRIPGGWEMVLSDFSAGMLGQARQNISDSRQFHFRVIDAQAIPFKNCSFDVVIANHMLYHLPDRPSGLTEIRRVLKPDGRLYASTIGERHMAEVTALISRFDPGIEYFSGLPADSFSLESGVAELGKWFANVRLQHYEDALVVTDADLLAEYILSGRLAMSPDRQPDFVQFLHQELEANAGEIYITKASGLFEASG